MDELTPAERAAVDRALKLVVVRWRDHGELDFVTLCQSMNAVAGLTIRELKTEKD